MSHDSAKPRIVVLAGPNGAGKSTSARAILQNALQVDEFVNADTIAQGLSAFEPTAVAFAAGRIMLGRLHELAGARANFAFETTLATRSFAPWIRELVEGGYEFHLVFLWLPTADAAVARVAERVRRGGHSVPEEVIRRRFRAGLRNFFLIYRPLAASWQVFDCRGSFSKLIARGHEEIIEEVHNPLVWQRLAAESL